MRDFSREADPIRSAALTIRFLERGLIVSCQALDGSPLNSPEILSAFAETAQRKGACAVRMNGVENIGRARTRIAAKIIGLEKTAHPGSEVYITPTRGEARRIVEAGAEIVAIDGTLRPRPEGEKLETLIGYIKEELGAAVLADISTLEEAIACQHLGVDAVATTLSGYTLQTSGRVLPDFELLERLHRSLEIPVICEGGVSTPQQMQRAFELGAFAVCVGRAITDLDWIIEQYVRHLPRSDPKS